MREQKVTIAYIGNGLRRLFKAHSPSRELYEACRNVDFSEGVTNNDISLIQQKRKIARDLELTYGLPYGTFDKLLDEGLETQKDSTKPVNKITLKPCPFCGGEAEIDDEENSDGYCHYTVKFVECQKCQARTVSRVCDGYYNSFCTDDEIAELWNKRC